MTTQVVAPPKPKPSKFELINTFEITVPKNYNHATRLDTFKVAHELEFRYYNPDTTDSNFSKATTQLVAGRKFQVKVFGIKKVVSSKGCLAKLCSEKAVLLGAHGMSLVYEQKKDELPKGKWSVSFDEKEALPVIDGRHWVPRVYRYSVKWGQPLFNQT